MSSLEKDRKTRLNVVSAAPEAPAPESLPRPTHWQSLAALEQRPEFREFVEREFSAPLEALPPNSPDRRRFMQVMGASLGLAGVSGCHFPEDKLLPLSRRPEDTIPGTSRYYATAMELDGVAVGLYASSYDGRPIKIEGNPAHPDSLGAASVYHQASVLGLYDPDRSDRVLRSWGGARKGSSWRDFALALPEIFQTARANSGSSLRVLAERSSSPTLLELKQRLLAQFPSAKWLHYEPASSSSARAGSILAFGSAYRSQLRLENARVVVCLDADIVAPSFPAGLANARALANGRMPEHGEMNRVYAIESAVSLTGALADHRLAVRSRLIKAVASALDARLSAKLGAAASELGPSQTEPPVEFLKDAKVSKLLDAMVADLVANPGRSLIVAGPRQPPPVHALVHRLNALLGNVGHTLVYTEDPHGPDPDDVTALAALTEEMNASAVDTLLIIGGNPVLTAPADVPFASALGKVKTSVHLSLYDDETSQKTTWHLPAAHYLESWGDARAFDGTISLVQPLIAPLHGGRSAIELVALVLGLEQTSALDLVRRTHPSLTEEHALRRALAKGVLDGSAAPSVEPKLRALDKLAFDQAELASASQPSADLELVFGVDPKLYDGRFANNAWLQELPDPMTRLSWDNAVLLSPRSAAALGVGDGEIVALTVGARSLEVLAVVAPSQADGSLLVTIGHGRLAAGHVGGLSSAGVATAGSNAYTIRSSSAYHVATGVGVKRIGPAPYRVSSTQDLYAMDHIGAEGTQARLPQIVREATLEEYKKEPHFVAEVVEHPPLLNLWVPPVSYDGHRWGMSIDLNRCIGCGACVTACQAENNIPVVGKEGVAKGREMLWLRVDRYYKGPPETAEVAFQPVPCQQCENAPCEQVCPVGATMHSHEGLNDMVYNRCIGTRYCSNNCPYKVRRFNYYNYNLDTIGVTPYTPTSDPKAKVKAMVFNPDVTVRSRGVMEKCTFCVQRIQNVKIKAKNVKRHIDDGEIKTACQQTCPTEAVVFGDLNDKASRVAALQKLPRSYALLEELNNRPRVQYLARVRNPNPELG